MVGVRAKDHDDKRQLILDKTAELIGQVGFHKASISAISSACGGSKAWVFHYFPNKEAILFTLLDDFFRIFRQRTAAAVEGENTPRARLRAYIQECVEIFDDYKINYPILFNEMKFLTGKEQTILRRAERGNIEILSQIIAEINPSLPTRNNLLSPVTFLAFGVLGWTHNWYQPGGEITKTQLVDLIEKLLMSGIETL